MKKRRNNLKAMLLLTILLISLDYIYATSENKVLIVTDNDAIGNYEELTSFSHYKDILTNINLGNNITYNITLWNETLNGNPALSYLQSFDVVIWTSGDYTVVVPSSTDIMTLEDYIEQGGNLIISGAWLINDYGQNTYTDNVLHANAPGRKYSTLRDINITNTLHTVTAGFAQNESVNLILSPSGFVYDSDVIENVVNDGQTLAVRGTQSANISQPTIVVFENTSNTARVIYFAFPIFLLNESNRTNLVENAMKWMDNHAPTVNSIDLIPGAAVDIDPDIGINITANITDIYNVSAAIFEYKCAQSGVCSPGTESWANTTMSYNLTTKLFENASFTPNSAAIWSYRVWTNDTLGNSNYSQIYNISVQYDYTWTITNLSGSVSCIINDICPIGNITINNTGDYDLSFDLSSNWIDTTSYNDTEPFTLAAGEQKTISINLTTTTSTTQREYDVTITADATTTNAVPDSAALNITFIVYVGGPYLKTNIVDYNISLTQGDSANLTASVKNIGNDTAVDTWLNWTLPIGWTNSSGNLSQFIGNLTSGSTSWNNITASLSSSASSGTATLCINSSCDYNNTICSNIDSAYVSVIVSCNVNDGVCGAGCSSLTDPDCAVAATGGGTAAGKVEGAAGAGAPGATAEVLTGIELINTTEEFEITRGYEDSFLITITNPYKYVNMYNVTLSVKGYLSQYLNIVPDKYDLIEINKSRAFNITIISPTYMERGEYPLEFNITSKLIGNVVTEKKNATITSWLRKDLIEKRLVNLFIYEVRKDDANDLLNESKDYVAELKKTGFSINKISEILENAEAAFLSRNYKLTKELSEQIKEIKEDAFKADELINSIEVNIKKADEKALKVDETKRLFTLALAAFEREDYKTAIQRAKDAGLSYVIETKGKVNIVKFIFDYYWYIIIFILFFSVSSYAIRNKMLLNIIKTKIMDLEKEQITINDLIKELQQKAFKLKSIDMAEYHKQMYNYEVRLSEIRQLVSELRAKRVGIIKISNEIKILEKEDKDVVNSIKKIQELYFDKQSLTKRSYDMRLEGYRMRRAEIEKSIVILETNLAKKEKINKLEEEKTRKKKIKRETKNKDNHVGIVKKINDGLVRLKEKNKPVPGSLAAKGQIMDVMNNLNTGPVLFIKSVGKNSINLIRNSGLNISKNLKNILIFKKPLIEGKKKIISRLKNKIPLNKIKRALGNPRDPSKDIESLESHGFKIKEPKKKKPTAQHIIPKSRHRNKNIIINHFREVYKT